MRSKTTKNRDGANRALSLLKPSVHQFDQLLNGLRVESIENQFDLRLQDQVKTGFLASAARVMFASVVVSAIAFGLMIFSSVANAGESVSPSYLWEGVTSFPLSRILICGDHPEKIEWHHGEASKAPRIAIYRNMSTQYFTTRDESSLNYDVPLGMAVLEDTDKFQRVMFLQTDESGGQKPFAELKLFPHGMPIWTRIDPKDHHRIEERCRGYRFSAEFIHR